jgi:hypothetical protein
LPYVGDIRPEAAVESGAESGQRKDEDKDENKDYVAIDSSGEGESSELVAQRANDGQMCR